VSLSSLSRECRVVYLKIQRQRQVSRVIKPSEKKKKKKKTKYNPVDRVQEPYLLNEEPRSMKGSYW